MNKCNVYCTSVDHFAAVNTVYARYFPKDPPARIFVCVPAWPGQFDLEIDSSLPPESSHGAEVLAHARARLPSAAPAARLARVWSRIVPETMRAGPASRHEDFRC